VTGGRSQRREVGLGGALIPGRMELRFGRGPQVLRLDSPFRSLPRVSAARDLALIKFLLK